MDDAPDAEVTPWPRPVRYALLAVLFAVVGVGLVVAFYDKGFLPIAGPFVVLALLPLLIPLRSRGLRNRARRLGAALTEELDELTDALQAESSLPAPHRPSSATDQSLAWATSLTRSARDLVAAGEMSAAVARVEELSRDASASWTADASVTALVRRTTRKADRLHGVLRQAGGDASA